MLGQDDLQPMMDAVLVHTARRHLAADEHLAAGRAGRVQLVDHLQPLRDVAQQRVEGGRAALP